MRGCCAETVTEDGMSVHFTSLAPDGSSAGREWYAGWTAFYYAWWIAWCPFVGIFIAKISRGRTVRQVIFGSLMGPATYTFIWFAMFGAAGLRMERQAANFGLTCDDPMTEIAGRQWWRLSCRSSTDMWFDLFSNYPMSKCALPAIPLYCKHGFTRVGRSSPTSQNTHRFWGRLA